MSIDLISKAKEIIREYPAVQKGVDIERGLRREIKALREQLADLVDPDDIIQKAKEIKRIQNKLDHALEKQLSQREVVKVLLDQLACQSAEELEQLMEVDNA